MSIEIMWVLIVLIISITVVIRTWINKDRPNIVLCEKCEEKRQEWMDDCRP